MKEINFLWIISILLFILGIIVGHSIGLNSNSCEGIGGFVYKEIEWQEQTINIIEGNCRNGLYVNDWEESEPFIYCYSEECNKDGYCKDKIIRFDGK